MHVRVVGQIAGLGFLSLTAFYQMIMEKTGGVFLPPPVKEEEQGDGAVTMSSAAE